MHYVSESADNREEIMKRLICLAHVFLAMAILLLLSMGCAGSTQETKTKIMCPKCGTYFGTSEGEETIRYIKGR